MASTPATHANLIDLTLDSDYENDEFLQLFPRANQGEQARKVAPRIGTPNRRTRIRQSNYSLPPGVEVVSLVDDDDPPAPDQCSRTRQSPHELTANAERDRLEALGNSAQPTRSERSSPPNLAQFSLLDVDRVKNVDASEVSLGEDHPPTVTMLEEEDVLRPSTVAFMNADMPSRTKPPQTSVAIAPRGEIDLLPLSPEYTTVGNAEQNNESTANLPVDQRKLHGHELGRVQEKQRAVKSVQPPGRRGSKFYLAYRQTRASIVESLQAPVPQEDLNLSSELAPPSVEIEQPSSDLQGMTEKPGLLAASELAIPTEVFPTLSRTPETRSPPLAIHNDEPKNVVQDVSVPSILISTADSSDTNPAVIQPEHSQHFVPVGVEDFHYEGATSTTVEDPVLSEEVTGDATKPSDIPTEDINATRSAIVNCLQTHLKRRRERHASSTASALWRQRTCFERESPGQRSAPKGTGLPSRFLQAVSPFQGMSKIRVPTGKVLAKQQVCQIVEEVFTKKTSKGRTIKSKWQAPITRYKSNAIDVPLFKEYVSLKTSILSDNVSKLLFTPFHAGEVEDDTAEDVLTFRRELCNEYEMERDENANLDLRREQCHFYSDTIHSFLDAIDITWDVILFWLLASSKDIGDINATGPKSTSFKNVLLSQADHHTEKFERAGETLEAMLYDPEDDKWYDFRNSLTKPHYSKLRLAALVCTAFIKECRLSIWYLAQQSESLQAHIMKKTKIASAPAYTYRRTACRVCHQHDCLLHGEIRQELGNTNNGRSNDAESSDEDSVKIPAHEDEDSDIEQAINYKIPVNSDGAWEHNNSSLSTNKNNKLPGGEFRPSWWLKYGEKSTMWEHRTPFIPCSHDGACDQANCRCFRERITCEKSCKCASTCHRRFPGCKSTCAMQASVCSSDVCLCSQFKRECDADLCTTCGATDILDPANRYNEELQAGRCCNVAIQRRLPRKTLLGHSELHGFGLYAGEDLKEDDYIGEYIGETISVAEGERRTVVYDSLKTMYIFRLNKNQEIDATAMGNKFRFINNADHAHSNCEPKILLCNTVFRIALFAKVDIKAGQELFFDYRYPEKIAATFKQPQLVAIKEQVKNTTKRKPPSSNVPLPGRDMSKIFNATAKARAAKAEKAAIRKAELARQATLDFAASPFGSQLARSAAIDPSMPSRQSVAHVPSADAPLRKSKSVSGLGSQSVSKSSDTPMEFEAGSNELLALADLHARAKPSRVVQETDEEDADLIPEDRLEKRKEMSNTDRDHAMVEDSEEESARRRPVSVGRTRSRTRSVIAVKGRHGGARPNAGRPKRKRPILGDSDDE